MTSFFLSQIFAFSPNSFFQIANVGGPHTSWVIKTSTLSQTFSPGITLGRLADSANIFSVIVIPIIDSSFILIWFLSYFQKIQYPDARRSDKDLLPDRKSVV